MLRPDTMPKIIINVEEGTNCGNVEQILLNKKKKCIDSFVISKFDEDGVTLEDSNVEYVLPFSELEGMGDYGIIIMSEEVILQKKGEKEKKEIYSGKSKLIGDVVVSMKGNKVGTVEDYSFSEEGILSSVFVELKENGKVEEFDISDVMSIGNGIVLVRTSGQSSSAKKSPEKKEEKSDDKEDKSDKKDEKAEEKKAEGKKKDGNAENENSVMSDEEKERAKIREEAKNFAKQMAMRSEEVKTQSVAVETEESEEDKKEKYQSNEISHQIQEEQSKIEEMEKGNEKNGIKISERRRHPKSNQQLVDDDQLIQKFIDKQKALLIGRVLTKDILDAKGKVLVEKGTEITEDIFDIAREERKDTIVEMAMFSE